MFKRVLKWFGIVLVVVLIGLGGFVAYSARAFNQSMAKVYDLPLPNITRSTDANVIARGQHVVESIGGCASADCHGNNLAGGKPLVMGPLGTITASNITPAGHGAEYSDGELARLILHGVKRTGQSVRFMPAQELNWLPDDDIQAVISYLRSVPPVTKPDGTIHIGLLAKVLDRRGMLAIDVARQINHDQRATAPTPAPTGVYGGFLSRSCTGCHGEHLSGGPIPGAPSSLPVPKNITPHESGLKAWSFADFQRLLDDGIKKDGKPLDPFMPVESFKKMNDIERQALWAFLQSVPSKRFGQH
jgi:mono/diheme cytochrome c family protein